MKPSALAVSICPLSTIRQFVERHHYSHSVNGVKIDTCFMVGCAGELVGGVIFGAMSTTAWKRFAESERSVLELRRLVLLDEAERNSESYVIGRCLRWLCMNRPEVEVIVSYADPAHGHVGTIYKASNFEYVGVSGADKGYRDPDTSKVYHSRALRTRGEHGEYKPFVVKLRDKYTAGQLEEIMLPGKHCYIYRFKRRPESRHVA